MLKKTLMASAIAATSLFSVGAYAQTYANALPDNGFSYTYGQLGYDHWDYDHGPNADVLSADGSFALDQHLFLRGGLGIYNGDYNYEHYGHDSNADGSRLYGGLGYHTPLQRGLDLVGTADVIHDNNDGNHNEWGYRLRAGVRNQTTRALQLSGGAVYEDVYDGNFGLYGQALVSVTPVVDVGARATVQDSENTIGVFGRYNF